MLARFAVVGTIGFVIDAGVLHVLVALGGWSPFAARAVSFPVALTATFILNRAWTFRALRMSPIRAYGAYGVIQSLGALLNLCVFTICLLSVPSLYQRPVIALAIGSIVAMIFNYYASRRVVFRP